MNLRTYFMGERRQLCSVLATVEVAERINEAAASSASPFSLGVAGGVRRGRVCLRYAKSPYEYNAKPLLAGRLRPTPSGSRLELVYRAPLWAYVFYAVWYSALIAVAVPVFLLASNADAMLPDKAFTLAIFFALTAFPFWLHALGTRDWDRHRDALIQFLSEKAQAV